MAARSEYARQATFARELAVVCDGSEAVAINRLPRCPAAEVLLYCQVMPEVSMER